MHIPSAFRLLPCLLIFSVSSVVAQQNPAQPPVQATAIVTVTDHGHPVTGLKAEDFTLYLDSQKLPISSVTSDASACIGLIIDRSGSMRGRHAAIASGMADFVRASNADDNFFVVTFNDEPFLEHEFTRDPGAVEQVIASAEARGGTALYDAIVASTDHLAENKICTKRALLIVGDGEDNSSRKGLEYTLASLRNGENPFVYAIWLPHPNNGTSDRAESTLKALTAPSGGAAYFIKSPDEVRKIALKIAEELKSQYTISYVATAKSANSEIKIEAHAAGHKDLTVHANIAAPKVSLPVPAAAIRNSCIVGTVLDENKKPVAGMNVEAFPLFSPNSYAKNSYPSIVSDEKGKFKIADLESGTYALYSSNESAGYPSTRNPFYRTVNELPTQASQKCSSVVVKAGPKAARLKIKAVDASTGAPLANFGVSLRKQSGGILVIQRAAPGQEVLVPPHTDLAISAWSYGFPKSQYIVVTTPGSETSQEVTVQLTPGSASSASTDR